MKFYGHADLNQNELQNAVLTTLTQFPDNAKVGQVAFVNSVVYICVTNLPPAPPVWVPLTQEITAYTHTQGAAANPWNINHGLNTTDIHVQVFDAGNNMIIPNEITITGPQSCTVQFAETQAGKAVVLTGHFTGNVKPTYAFTFFQNAAATEWTIVHNLGYNPIVRVFIGTNEVQPANVSHPDTNTTVLTFTSAVAGLARLI